MYFLLKSWLELYTTKFLLLFYCNIFIETVVMLVIERTIYVKQNLVLSFYEPRKQENKQKTIVIE